MNRKSNKSSKSKSPDKKIKKMGEAEPQDNKSKRKSNRIEKLEQELMLTGNSTERRNKVEVTQIKKPKDYSKNFI